MEQDRASGPDPGTVPGDDPALEARRLLRAARGGTLATSAAGQPFASLVTPATAPDGSVLLLLSDLSEHTRHLRAEPRCALLVAGAAEGPNPQTAPRLTITGLAELEPDPALHARWVAAHPYAAFYAGFGDFHLWRLRPRGGLFVAGFARAHRLREAQLAPDPDAVAAVAAAEAGIIAHCNADHADALALIAGLHGGRPSDGSWRLAHGRGGRGRVRSCSRGGGRGGGAARSLGCAGGGGRAGCGRNWCGSWVRRGSRGTEADGRSLASMESRGGLSAVTASTPAHSIVASLALRAWSMALRATSAGRCRTYDFVCELGQDGRSWAVRSLDIWGVSISDTSGLSLGMRHQDLCCRHCRGFVSSAETCGRSHRSICTAAVSAILGEV